MLLLVDLNGDINMRRTYQVVTMPVTEEDKNEEEDLRGQQDVLGLVIGGSISLKDGEPYKDACDHELHAIDEVQL